MHKPKLEAHLAQNFNEIAMQDCFFLWGQTFTLMIDECIKWKTGDHIVSRTTPVLLKSFIDLWGPMGNLMTDQEGGIIGQ